MLAIFSPAARILAASLALAVSTPVLAWADEPETGYGDKAGAPSAAPSVAPSAAPTDGWGSSRGTDPWGASSATDPYGGRRPAPAPFAGRLERNKPLIAAGAVTMGAGFLGIIGGLSLIAGASECEYLVLCRLTDPAKKTAGEVTAMVSLVTLVAGIPMLVMGVRKSPVKPSTLQAMGHPAPGGWGWTF